MEKIGGSLPALYTSPDKDSTGITAETALTVNWMVGWVWLAEWYFVLLTPVSRNLNLNTEGWIKKLERMYQAFWIVLSINCHKHSVVFVQEIYIVQGKGKRKRFQQPRLENQILSKRTRHVAQPCAIRSYNLVCKIRLLAAEDVRREDRKQYRRRLDDNESRRVWSDCALSNQPFKFLWKIDDFVILLFDEVLNECLRRQHLSLLIKVLKKLFVLEDWRYQVQPG